MSATRLVVKDLPHYCTPERLRQHFETSSGPGGKLTDVKVSFKSDGTSRRFGFIGYKTSEETLKAKEWFDKTFIDSARIRVDLVEDKAEFAHRPAKRRRLSPVPIEVEKPEEAAPKNKHLDEYLEVMQPRNKGPSWANEASVPQPVAPIPAPEPSNDAIDVDESEAPREELSDMEWMRRRMNAKVDEVEKEKAFEQSDDEDAPPKTKAKDEPTGRPQPARPPPLSDPTRDTIKETARLFVRNLTFSCTEDELSEIFSPFGTISKVHIPVDTNTKEGKGIAYVTFSSPDDAISAYEGLDKKPFQGRLLHILGAVDRKGKMEVVEGEGRKKTVKEDKMATRKALAGKVFNWSMLYMNSDAVASSIADRMHVPKSAILNPEPSEGSTNPAVKLALAETHIITETKAFFESHGVVLSSLSTKTRSDTIILVKNIPYGTTEAQIRELFKPHGDLDRVLVPPAGTIAVVEFAKPDEAYKALKAVAYRRLGNSIVYLEKGPIGMFTEGEVADRVTNEEDKALLSKTTIRVPSGTDVEATSQEPVSGGTTLYVKNLSFATTQEKLTQLLSHLPSFAFARVQTKPDPKNPAGRLSMGYGFVGFKDEDGANKALKSLQGFVVDGHELHVKFAGRGKEEMAKEVGATGVGAKARTTKMIVKNIPFEATKKDIRELFSSHGKLKSVRLPKKFDSQTRGFAFLEFVSRHEAESAFNALRHTHLLGRHLVLEWAEEEEHDLDALRKKAGVGFGDGKAMPGRKRKLDLGKKGQEEDPEDLDV
ncbi:RNA-binding domain-containing protein [Coprinopsis marcescibilis]|uniref:Multiple RNA-binding domain-containing protein 1 n=1 Tax=Coprinopsis marcescibilis TaxID=230819 RepID=A0A5C3L2J5_COPMA|nr:RNA-binding domain-containing protein [Coprinopsis marcescibilis]